MANRTIELSLKADVGRFVAGLSTARKAVNDTAKDVSTFVRNNQQDMQTAGASLATLGAGLTAASGLAIKAAIDWETAWAGVQKTNDGTAEQMTGLEEDLRNLATTLPATHEEIAAVAEAAGQLGVGVDDVAEFTETMVNLGETTNLSADEAATALARFSNITGTSFSDVDKLGSALVGLGNNFATTEAEILHMSEGMASAGTQAGFSEGEILGLATAMSAVGINAEAGGTAITQTFNEIDGAVREGGDALEGWAELAGTTAEDFAEIWRNEPAEAMDMVVVGLSEVAASGGDVNGTLEDLGITGERQARVMRDLASAGEIAGDAMAMGNEEFERNGALSEEAAVRYETAAAQIQTAWNNIVDAAITAGSSIAPVVGDIAEGIGDLAGWFGDLPDPVLGTVTALSGVAGVASLAAGGLLILAPRAVEVYDAFVRLNESSRPLAKGLRSVGKASLVATAVSAVGLAFKAIYNAAQPAAAGVEEITTQLLKFSETGDIGNIDELFDFSGIGPGATEIDNLADALDALDPSSVSQHMESFGATVLGLENPTAKTIEVMEGLDEALTNMSPEDAASQFSRLREEAEAAGRQDFSSWKEMEELLPGYAESVRQAANATGESYEEAELLEIAMGNLPPAMQNAKDAADNAAKQDELTGALEEVGVAADGTVDSLSDYLDMLFQTGLAHMDQQEAQRQYTESLNSFDETVKTLTKEHGNLNDAIDETTGLFSTTTETGIALGREFDNIAQSGMDSATAMAEAGAGQEEIQESLEGTYKNLVDNARQFVDTDDEAKALARSVMGIEDDVDIETWMEETAQETANELGASLDEIPEGLFIIAEMNASAREEAFKTAEAIDLIPKHEKVDVAVSDNGTPGQVQRRIDSIKGKEEYVFVTDDGTTTTVQQQIVNIDGVNRTVYVGDDGTVYATQSQIDGISDGSSTVYVTSSGLSAVENALNTLARDRTSHIKVVTSAPKQARPSYMLNAGGYAGGRASRDFGFNKLPHLANGGRLPYTGLGTDQILGVSSLGHPVAMLDDLEWTINRRSSDKYDSVLDRINRDHPSVQHLAHLRDGGRAGQLASTAMAMSPTVNVAAPPVDTAAIGAAVASAMSGFRPIVNIGGREFYGVMQDVGQQFGNRF